jgi:hypothetical protein
MPATLNPAIAQLRTTRCAPLLNWMAGTPVEPAPLKVKPRKEITSWTTMMPLVPVDVSPLGSTS